MRTRLQWQEERWHITVAITRDGQTGMREVAVPGCDDAADFVTVAVVLALDPARAEDLGIANSGSAKPPARTDEERAQEDRERVRAGSHEGQPLSPSRKTRPQPGTRVRPHLSLSGEAALGALPSAALGLGAQAGLDVGRISLGLGGLWFPSARTSPEAALAPIDFALAAGQASVVRWFLGPKLELGPILSARAGVIRARQAVSGAQSVREPWLALGAGVAGIVDLHAFVKVFGEVELMVPLTQPNFVLSDGSEVQKVGVGARGAVGVRIFFLGE